MPWLTLPGSADHALLPPDRAGRVRRRRRQVAVPVPARRDGGSPLRPAGWVGVRWDHLGRFEAESAGISGVGERKGKRVRPASGNSAPAGRSVGVVRAGCALRRQGGRGEIPRRSGCLTRPKCPRRSRGHMSGEGNPVASGNRCRVFCDRVFRSVFVTVYFRSHQAARRVAAFTSGNERSMPRDGHVRQPRQARMIHGCLARMIHGCLTRHVARRSRQAMDHSPESLQLGICRPCPVKPQALQASVSLQAENAARPGPG